MSEQDPSLEDVEQPLTAHLIELRDRLLRIVLCVAVIVVALFPFANDIYHLIAAPIVASLPVGSSMIAVDVTSPFLTPFKLVLVTSIFVSIPYIFYQIWSFIAPALYRHEKRLMIPMVISSVLLFYSGMLFAFYVVFPLVFGFLMTMAPADVSVMPDIKSYLSVVLTLFFAFGIAFEVPIATILLVKMGMVSRESLAAKRPFIIVAAFIFGMILTPPDVISQVLLAIPMWLLFEAGLYVSRFVEVKGNKIEEPEV